MANEPNDVILQDRRDRDYAIDRRMTVLETRFDTMLPLLATKADVAGWKSELNETKIELKAEIQSECAKVKTELAKWMLGISLTLFIGFGGMFFAIWTGLPR